MMPVMMVELSILGIQKILHILLKTWHVIIVEQREKFRTDELTIMTRKDNKLNMKGIFINDCEYGLRRLKRKVERLKRRQENLEQIESLSLYGAEDLGRIKEAIYIYEDLIDIWEN